LGKVLKINIKSFQYEENVKIFKAILEQIKDKLRGAKLEKIKQSIKDKIFTQKSIFNELSTKL